MLAPKLAQLGVEVVSFTRNIVQNMASHDSMLT
jgi:hypothetical protein